jgi:hypothetical protein
VSLPGLWAGGGYGAPVVSDGAVVPLVDQISLGVLTVSIPRDDVDVVIAEHGRQARRKGGTLPPRVMMYYVAALAICSDDDYVGVMRWLTGPLQRWGSWDRSWRMPTSGGITQARARLGYEPVKAVFERIARPVGSLLTPGVFCAHRRMVSLDGMVFDLPDTATNAGEFGKPPGGVFPQARVVTLVECGTHVSLGAVIGGVTGKGCGERSAAAQLLPLLEPGMLLLCDQGFYSFDLWCAAADSGADLLWRVGDIMALPIVDRCGDGSYRSVVFAPGTSAKTRAGLVARARDGDDLTGAADRARLVRVIEYEVTDRGSGDLICLITTIADPREAPAAMLADAYHERWEHEQANRQIKSQLRGPGKILRSQNPDMVRQELYGYLLAHYAICALIARAATETGIDPDRLKFANTVRIVRDRLAEPGAFSP